MSKTELIKLCDKLEDLLTEEEGYLSEQCNEWFHDVTWDTWGKLREALTGYDCAQVSYKEDEL